RIALMATIPATTRRSHYENAFEHYLTAAGVPFVAVSDVKKSVPGPLGIKAFDYIVYPPDSQPWLVDVKGRKFARRSGGQRRWQSWVTQADVDGLTQWREVFGSDFSAAFIFIFWLSNGARPPVEGAEYHALCGRVYGSWGVELQDYRAHAKTRSARWKTLDLPTEQFIRLAWPLTRWIRN